MPVINKPVVNMGNAAVTEYVDTVNTTDTLYTFLESDLRDYFKIENVGTYDLVVTVAGSSYTLKQGEKKELNVSYSSFTVRAATNTAAFRVRSSYFIYNEEDEKKLSNQISDVSSTQLSGNTVIILGDSITNQNGVGDYIPSATGDLYYYSSDGYFTWANVMLNHRLKLLANKGIGGQRTDEILARVDADVINFSPKPAWCIVYGGTNDIGQGVPYATVISNLKTICEKLNKANIKVVLCTITPATNASTNALKQQVLQINNWIRNYCVDIPNVVLCDWYKAYVDIATNQPIANATRDGVHPSPFGAAIMGQILADSLKYIVPSVDTLISANVNEGNLLTNGMLTGNTSGVATGATVYDATDYTATKVARTDGLGEWQQVTFNNTIQTGKIQWQNTNVGVDWNVGDKVYADLEFQVDDGTVMKFANLVVVFYGAASGSTADLRRTGADIEPSYLLKTGVMRTPIATIPANTTRLQLQFNFKGQGTFRVGRVSIRKA